MGRKHEIVPVHQDLWEMEEITMPLALGYLKAMVEGANRTNVDRLSVARPNVAAPSYAVNEGGRA